MHMPLTRTPHLPACALRGLIVVLLLAIVAGCGFRLKGTSPLPFTTLYTNIEENSAFGAYLRRAIIASSPNTVIVQDPVGAQARLTQVSMTQSLREVSISPEGQVEEYELNLEFVFQLTDANGRVVLPPTRLRATREIPYDPNVLQAKQGEISSLFLEMQRSLVDRIVRRLTAPEVANAFQDPAQRPAPTPDQIDPLEPAQAQPSGSPDEAPIFIPRRGVF